jgi:hypothetical protein
MNLKAADDWALAGCRKTLRHPGIRRGDGFFEIFAFFDTLFGANSFAHWSRKRLKLD